MLLRVSLRTLQGWEQGRKQPSGAVRTLLTIAGSQKVGVKLFLCTNQCDFDPVFADLCGGHATLYPPYARLHLACIRRATQYPPPTIPATASTIAIKPTSKIPEPNPT